MLPQIPLLNQNYKPLLTITLKKPEPTEQLYTIKDKDTLTSISEATGSSVERLWAKNPALTNPDIINPGQSLTIPKENEVLQDRVMPVTIKAIAPTTVDVLGGFSNSRSLPPPSGSSVEYGNLYAPGYCTYYAKNIRPDMPNNLGNADTWAINAAAQGLRVSNTPQVGAVAVALSYMHVAIVTAVHGKTIEISEMNYKGLWVVSTRETPISEFSYIL